jgi:outer membrane protein OmpA-like peptidoglycan-associated protein
MTSLKICGLFVPLLLAVGCSSTSQTPPSQGAEDNPPAQTANAAPAPNPPPAQPAPTAQSGSTQPSPEAVLVYFSEGSAELDPSAQPLVDYTARLFREGNPFVMTVVGHTDRVGQDYSNLILSARRAAAVKQALVARGIPADRLQIQAVGISDPAVQGSDESADAQNRRVRITWK